MRRKRIYVVSGIVGCLLLVAMILFLIMQYHKWSEETAYSENANVFYVDDGAYYVDDHCLYFMDAASGESVAVCTKPNCKHTDDSCEAYYDGVIGDMFVYDNHIYVAYFYSDFSEDENGETVCDSRSVLVCTDLDGKNRKKIYEADTGAVLSMLAVDGTLYYTAYTFQNGYEENTYLNDCTLYAYDLTWKTTKTLTQCTASKECYNASMILMQHPDSNGNLRLIYTYYDEDATMYSKIQTYHVKDGEIESEDVSGLWMLPESCTVDGTEYLFCQNGDAVIASPEPGNEEDALFVMDNGWDMLSGNSIILIFDDYKKAIYNIQERQWYIANTSFQDTGSYIKDIHAIDDEHGIIYYDATDYSSYKPGDLLTENISQKTCGSLSDFLEENFIRYEDLSEQQKQSLSWITIRE